MTLVSLATEDALSESIGKRLIAAEGLDLAHVLRKNGNGYLRGRIKNWCEFSRNVQPLILLTDLDDSVCPAALIERWLGTNTAPLDLLFRVAVHEIESWLLADHEAMKYLFGTKVRLPSAPDALTDPKRHLLDLAKRASRPVRDDLVAPQGAIASQGVGYNARLCALVEEHWNPERASSRSPSLARARQRLRQLALRAPKRK